MKQKIKLFKLYNNNRYLFISLSVILTIVSIFINTQKNTIYAKSSNDQGYTKELKYLIKLALKHSPVLKGEAYQTRIFKELHSKESIFTKNPVFSFAHQNIPVTSWPSLNQHAMSGLNLGISQTLAFPWEDYYRKKKLWNAYLSQKEKESDTERNLIKEITIIFHQIHFLYEKIKILSQSKESLKRITNTARSLVALNKMNSAQLLKLEADTSKINSDLFKIQAMLSKKQAQMEMLCGHKVRPDIWGMQINSQKAANWLRNSNTIKMPKNIEISMHPVLKASRLKVAQTEAGYLQAKSGLFPGIELSANYTFRQELASQNSAFRSGEDFISFKASMPIPLYYPAKEKKQISAAKHTLKKQKEELRAMQLMLEALWKGEKENANKILQSYKNYEQEVLPKYFSAYQAYISFLPSGTISLLDVLDAYRQYLQVSVQRAEIFFELMQSLAKLNYLGGQL